MKNFVLAFLLLFYTGQLFGQNVSPREVVKKSFLKLTGGRKLESFGLTVQYGKPGKIPAQLLQRDSFMVLMDSLMRVVPDSVKTKMIEGKRLSTANLYDELYQTRAGVTEQLSADFLKRKIVQITIRPNKMRGSIDTSRYVQVFNPDGLSAALKFNPVSILQYMLADTADLHYTGTTLLHEQMHHIIQVRMGKKWVDVLIGVDDLLPARVIFPQIDADPLIGVGPEHFKEIFDYAQFKKVGDFILPAMVEEIVTRTEFTINRRLEWSDLNASFPESLFFPEPGPYEKAQFKVTGIGQRLFVMEMTGGINYARSLIRVTGNGVDVFTNFTYNELINSKMRKAISDRFPDLPIRGLFTPESISSLYSLSNLFDMGTVLHFPRGKGFLSSERLRGHNLQEDSTWRMRLGNHTIDMFEKDFELDGYQVSILNPEETSEYAMPVGCFYLPLEKVVYAKGLFYYSNGQLNKASKWEKYLFEKINAKKWQVDNIIFNESMVDIIPLRMTYEDFERRVRAQ